MDAPSPRPGRAADVAAIAWLSHARERVERDLDDLLVLPDEAGIDPRWSAALGEARAFAARPAKRLRPALVVLGWGAARGLAAVPDGVWRFAASLELLHTFLLIHDDVADGAAIRRGGPALHRCLADGRRGEDLAVVVGDHLFARALEAMLESALPRAGEVARYWLGVCRSTAAGQFLDLALARTPLAEVTLFQTLRVGLLKTARYGFVAPLVGGARLAAAEPAVLRGLERVGRQVGVAFQIRDDLLGLFGEPACTGKPVLDDLVAGKPTYPIVAAYARAPAPVRADLDRLWSGGLDDPAGRARLLALVEAHGGRAAAERVIVHASRAAARTLRALPVDAAVRALLDELIGMLAARAV
ncbi:MAG: polyprenyl synthetase family protein [bacterium]|nr:polyprenyl synthetase family protein [bacterium]